jgi:hypothetical protein
MVRRKRHMQGGSIKEFRRDVEIRAALEVQRSKPPAPVVEEALTIPGFFRTLRKSVIFHSNSRLLLNRRQLSVQRTVSPMLHQHCIGSTIANEVCD